MTTGSFISAVTLPPRGQRCSPVVFALLGSFLYLAFEHLRKGQPFPRPSPKLPIIHQNKSLRRNLGCSLFTKASGL